MKHKGLILLSIFFAGILFIYLLTKGDSPVKRTTLLTGDKAPLFEAKDTDGRLWRLADLNGKVVLLNFWATWCDTCKMEKPFFNNLYNTFKDSKDIVLLSVLYNDDIQKGKQYMQRHDYRFPLLADEQISSKYGVRGVPETFVIDKKGVLAQKIIGPTKWDSEEVIEALKKLLK